MAKKPAKPETDQDLDADGDGASGGGKKKLIMIAGGALALVLVGAGGAYFTGLLDGVLGGAVKVGDEVIEPPKPSFFVDLPEMTVNLSSTEQRPTFLKVAIALEVPDKRVAALIEPVMPRVLDAFQVYLRELRVTDLDGSAGIHRLKEELARRVNIAVHPARIDSVLFKEILIQ